MLKRHQIHGMTSFLHLIVSMTKNDESISQLASHTSFDYYLDFKMCSEDKIICLCMIKLANLAVLTSTNMFWHACDSCISLAVGVPVCPPVVTQMKKAYILINHFLCYIFYLRRSHVLWPSLFPFAPCFYWSPDIVGKWSPPQWNPGLAHSYGNTAICHENYPHRQCTPGKGRF